MIVVLDNRAVELLDKHTIRGNAVRSLLQGARNRQRRVYVPTVVLAELYRGRSRSQWLDSLLAQNKGFLTVEDTTRDLARIVGGVLDGANADSAHIVDAHVVALIAARGGRGLIITGAGKDMTRLAAPYPQISVRVI